MNPFCTFIIIKNYWKFRLVYKSVMKIFSFVKTLVGASFVSQTSIYYHAHMPNNLYSYFVLQ